MTKKKNAQAKVTKLKLVPKPVRQSKDQVLISRDDLKWLFDGLKYARDSMAILVRALRDQNCEYDDLFATRLQSQGVTIVEIQMGAIERLAGLEEGEWFGRKEG